MSSNNRRIRSWEIVKEHDLPVCPNLPPVEGALRSASELVDRAYASVAQLPSFMAFRHKKHVHGSTRNALLVRLSLVCSSGAMLLSGRSERVNGRRFA